MTCSHQHNRVPPRPTLAQGREELEANLALRCAGSIWSQPCWGALLEEFLLLGVECQFPWVVEEGLGIQRVIARDNQKDGCKGVNETETSTSLVGEDDAEEKLFGCQVGVLQNC